MTAPFAARLDEPNHLRRSTAIRYAPLTHSPDGSVECEQWIKEGKGAIWSRLSLPYFTLASVLLA
jgi:hypothetical protein